MDELYGLLGSWLELVKAGGWSVDGDGPTEGDGSAPAANVESAGLCCEDDIFSLCYAVVFCLDEMLALLSN